MIQKVSGQGVLILLVSRFYILRPLVKPVLHPKTTGQQILQSHTTGHKILHPQTTGQQVLHPQTTYQAILERAVSTAPVIAIVKAIAITM